MQSRIIANATADAFGMPNTRGVPLATGEDTGGAWEALELTLQPGAASPPHTLSADKVFYLAEGVLDVDLGMDADGVTHTLRTGDVAHVPAGVPHRYRNTSDATARLVVLVTGAAQVSFLRGMSALGRSGPPAPEAVAEHAAAHGVRIMAPAG